MILDPVQSHSLENRCFRVRGGSDMKHGWDDRVQSPDGNKLRIQLSDLSNIGKSLLNSEGSF